MSRISLCLIEGKPPLGQLRACSTVNLTPQTQWAGKCGGCHPYLKHSASRNAPYASRWLSLVTNQVFTAFG